MGIIDDLKDEEGFRASPYYCSEGYPTVGYGKKLGPKHTPLLWYTFRVPEPVAAVWLQHDVAELAGRIQERHPREWDACNTRRRDVLIAMAYQLGLDGLANFKRTLAAIERGDFAAAADEMLDSKWATQTPARARRLAEVMTRGN